MNVTSYRNIESWIAAAIHESYEDHGHLSHYPTGQYNKSDQWGEVLTIGYYASNIDQSNWETISTDIEKRYPREVKILCPVFKCSGIWVKLLTTRGKPTQAAQYIYDVLYALESDYPVFDSDDLSKREYDQQLGSIENTLRGDLIDSVPDDYAQRVFSWLWDNDQDSIITEDTAYCSDLGVYTAAYALGFIEDNDPDEIPIPFYVLRSFDYWVESAFNRRSIW